MTNSTNPYTKLGPADFDANLLALRPPGPALSGPNWSALMGGFAQAFGDLHARATVLSDTELVPGEAIELLPDWEFDFGLPDCCTPLGITIAQRHNTLLSKIAQLGGQSKAYYIAVAAALGWVITITEGAVGSHAWTINVAQSVQKRYFRAGGNVAGDRLVDWTGNDQLECVIRQIMPAHTVLNFAYGS